jgi:peptidoglycan hydrolase CwlO-like protein
MIKYAVIGLASVVTLSTLVFGRDVVSYVKTFGTSARAAIKSEVPIEFEIQRARDLVANLVPDIRKCMHVIAEEEVGVEHLGKEIARAENELGKQKGEILALRNDLEKGHSTYQYASRTYTSNDVKRDLACRFERFKTAEMTVASKKQILAAREKSLIAAREKLEGMLASKRDLEVQIENLDARMKTIQAAQTATTVQLDDSQLARAKKLIADLNKQLDVQQKVLDADGKFSGLIPIDTASQVPEDLSNQIDEYFGRGEKSEEGHKVAERL